MPLLIHTMARTLAVHGETVKLTGEAHCKISNAVGDAGGKAVAFGISAKAADANAQSDVTVFNNKQNKFGQTQTVSKGRIRSKLLA